jgi:hypothetical protein
MVSERDLYEVMKDELVNEHPRKPKRSFSRTVTAPESEKPLPPPGGISWPGEVSLLSKRRSACCLQPVAIVAMKDWKFSASFTWRTPSCSR